MLLKSAITSFGIVAASVGGCGRTSMPPPPVTQQSEGEDEVDPYAGMPEECRELLSECPDCDEVESMRRQILAKKCVPVCDAYVARSQAIDQLVPTEGIEALRADDVCGKEGAACTAVEESLCSYSIDFVNAGRRFRAFWSEPGSAPPADELIDIFYAQMLRDYLDHQTTVVTWARANAADATPALRVGGALMMIMGASAVDGFLVEVETAAEDDGALTKRVDAVKALIALITDPGDITTLAERRKAAEKSLALSTAPQ